MTHRLAAVTVLVALSFACQFSSGEAPALPPLDLKETDFLSTKSSVFVKRFNFEGNTAFTDSELRSLTSSYTDRELSSEDLEDIRQELTLHYVNHGYINSGAVLPDQRIDEAAVTYRIVEGRLTDVIIHGNKRLRSNFIRRRAVSDRSLPLNIQELQRRLQVLRLNPNIKRVNAELKPGARPGESYLDVRIAEANPLVLALEVNNYRTPTVGGERLLLHAAHRNVSGFGDTVALTYGITKDDLEEIDLAGNDDIDLSYTMPLLANDTTLTVGYGRHDFTIIEEPFADLNIESQSENIAVSLAYPVYRTYNRDLTLSLTGEWRQSKTFLLSDPFGFSQVSGDGRSRVTVIRLVQSWTQRSMTSVVAIRSSFNFGVDAFNATRDGTTSRDAKYFSWLGQFQLVKRLGDSANQVIFRNNIQLTDDKLLSLEQFSVGGHGSVRGYRENQMVRDRGAVASLEFRIPVVFDTRGREQVSLAPFVDYGFASNNGSGIEQFNEISSAGLGVLFTPNEHVDMRLYWGHALTDVDNDDNDLQDHGIHFSLRFDAF